jgi:voltage-gated potassium channel Kch
MRPLRISARRFWLSDRMLVALLAMLVLLIFAIPLVPFDRAGRIAIDLFLSLLLLSGIATLARSRAVLWVGTALAAAALTVRLLDRLLPGDDFASWDALLTGSTEATLALVLLVQLFRPGRVTFYRVAGAVVVFLLFGHVFVEAYYLIESLSPGSFRFVSPPVGRSGLNGRLVYFSFATLSTVGYGDVTALHPLARSLAAIEALTGQLYPAILIARFVALALQSGPAPRAPQAGPGTSGG